MKKNKGITLIALVITIIILLILSGVAISMSLGNNGLFSKTKQAKEEYIKAQLKEELEIEIANIQSTRIADGKELKREDLSELSNIGAKITSYEIPTYGEYKNYKFKIDEKYKVKIYENFIKEPEIIYNGYPIIEATGITFNNKITIIYDETIGIENYYSIDNGVTWNKYIEPLESTNVETVMAKSVYKGNIESQTSKNIVKPTDILGTEAYDGDENIGYTIDDGTELPSCQIMVSPSAIGKNIKVILQSRTIAWGWVHMYWIKNDGSTGEPIVSCGNGANINEVYNIPNDVRGIKFEVQKNARILEIKLVE